MAAVSKTLASTMLSLLREVVFGVGLALLLPVSDILTFFIAVFIIWNTYRKLNTDQNWVLQWEK